MRSYAFKRAIKKLLSIYRHLRLPGIGRDLGDSDMWKLFNPGKIDLPNYFNLGNGKRSRFISKDASSEDHGILSHRVWEKNEHGNHAEDDA